MTARIQKGSVEQLVLSYPDAATKFFLRIRELMDEVVDEEGLGEISESLKWGEPSFSCKGASPIRVAWKPENPGQVSVFFNCNTKLVETFREIYGDKLLFKGNREIYFLLSHALPEKQLKHCISMALRYQKIKNLPLLGA